MILLTRTAPLYKPADVGGDGGDSTLAHALFPAKDLREVPAVERCCHIWRPSEGEMVALPLLGWHQRLEHIGA